MIKIIKFDSYLDGGTIEVITNKGIYCFDDRIDSKTIGRLYDGYPKDDNSNIILDSKILEGEIVEALKEHNDEFYVSSIKSFISSREKN